MVPNGWELRELKELTTIYDGTHATPKYVESGVPFYSVEHLTKGDFSKTKFITEEVFDKENKRVKLERHDILMTRIGDIGTAVHLDWDVRASFYVSLALLKATSNFDSSFMTQYINSSEFHRELWKRIIHVAFPKKINLGEIGKCHVCVPPLPEQRKIAKILSTWDKAISTTERLIDNSKQQKKALMQQLLTGKKRLLDDSGKPFSDEWEEVKLGKLGTTFTSLTGKTKSDFGSGKLYVPYINIFKNASVDINYLERVNISENERQNEVKFGDIFFTTSSETPEEVGMSSVMLDMPNEAVYLNSFCFGFRLHSFEQATPIFMKHVLRSSSVRRSISILAQGATRYNLSKTQLLKVEIPLPKKAEQQKIASVLNNADKEIKLLKQQLADLKQEKKALMQQLLTGKRRVKV
ncbi:MAG: restriction endonuclease subunit S [Pseudoalteromonas sp.]|uniref:restriction endonuclease subunit S n=1 Tax=Pseudoalteromonas sp. TaxID=53249 RepID=UPI003F9CAE3D